MTTLKGEVDEIYEKYGVAHNQVEGEHDRWVCYNLLSAFWTCWGAYTFKWALDAIFLLLVCNIIFYFIYKVRDSH